MLLSGRTVACNVQYAWFDPQHYKKLKLKTKKHISSSYSGSIDYTPYKSVFY